MCFWFGECIRNTVNTNVIERQELKPVEILTEKLQISKIYWHLKETIIFFIIFFKKFMHVFEK